jgi:hypothetical protein
VGTASRGSGSLLNCWLGGRRLLGPLECSEGLFVFGWCETWDDFIQFGIQMSDSCRFFSGGGSGPGGDHFPAGCGVVKDETMKFGENRWRIDGFAMKNWELMKSENSVDEVG